MSSEWKDILIRSGDENLGATLIRLARQATALHQCQVAASQLVNNGSAETGPDPMVQAPHGHVRMEVNA